MGSNLVVLILSMTLLAILQPLVAEEQPPLFISEKWHIHVINGLSTGDLYAHCKSKDTDIGEHNIVRGAEIQWSFRDNVWGRTLFWCFLRKPNGDSVSMEVFWHESKHFWLHYRCTKDGTCFWTAKDDGVYLRNLPEGYEELIHKWSA